jgi:hypothetical protein
MTRVALTAAAVLALAGCAPARMKCAGTLGHPMLVVDLYFGRSIPGLGEVSEEDWRKFEDRVVTPNLANGYTAHNAAGAWMNPVTHKTIHEATKVLTVAIPDVPESLAAIGRIREAYQIQFRQQLVGMTAHPACGSF